MSSPENPNAFPAPDDGRPSDGYGMTLRDWFAGQALTSIADRPLSHGMSQLAPNSPMHPDKAAAAAYRYADAMLVERSKAKPEKAMQHVAYYDEGQFHWMSGIAPRDCELFAAATGDV